jgi:hypothetical protein
MLFEVHKDGEVDARAVITDDTGKVYVEKGIVIFPNESGEIEVHTINMTAGEVKTAIEKLKEL